MSNNEKALKEKIVRDYVPDAKNLPVLIVKYVSGAPRYTSEGVMVGENWEGFAPKPGHKESYAKYVEQNCIPPVDTVKCTCAPWGSVCAERNKAELKVKENAAKEQERLNQLLNDVENNKWYFVSFDPANGPPTELLEEVTGPHTKLITNVSDLKYVYKNTQSQEVKQALIQRHFELTVIGDK